MNVEQAKAIAIAEILAKLELYPFRDTKTDATYFSPLRNERTPSFHVSKDENVWFDHGEGIGGNAFELVVQILKASGHRHSASDALRWLSNTNLDPALPKTRDIVRDKQSKWQVLDAFNLLDFFLIRYLEERGINVKIAKRYVSEIYIQHKKSRTKVFAIGFKNEDGGYELRNAKFKSSVSPKTITFIRADEPNPDNVMVFEGFMDFLSYATIKKGKVPCDIIVLNSVACVDHAFRYIKNYGYKNAYTWMDNDKAGEKAKDRLARFIETEPGLIHKPMNAFYKNYKDVNEFHMYTSGLKPIQ